jgi:murein DD-endopeptidase MepM/ murein hydrolase activator NlpD
VGRLGDRLGDRSPAVGDLLVDEARLRRHGGGSFVTGAGAVGDDGPDEALGDRDGAAGELEREADQGERKGEDAHGFALPTRRATKRAAVQNGLQALEAEGGAVEGKGAMQVRPVFPALAVALIAAAAVGPPAVAAPGEGGGTAVPTGGPGSGGGAVYGQPVPRSTKAARRAKRAKRAAARRERRSAERRARRQALGDSSGHRFPIAGPFGWGGPDSGFGAKRPGHRHQGQDLSAALGTPVVAPRAGTVEFVGYQARGAGHYVILDGDGEDFDYAFMHLRRGSITVTQGEQVALGQQLGEVGNTGSSSGPHLHFEIWVGGWYTGGHPIDPSALLQAWAGAA